MPGPFSSESYRGTFDNDISKIKQNEILSSKTFNNFVRSLYNLFYTDSVYRNVYKSSGQEASSTIMAEANYQSTVGGPGWTQSANPDANPVEHEMSTVHLWIRNEDNSDNPDEYDTDPKGHLCITPILSDTNALNFPELSGLADKAKDAPEHVFFGTGDVSVSVKPYALFATDTTSSAYCCITYMYGVPVAEGTSGYAGNTYTPKYSSMTELVFVFDPTIDSSDTAIRKVWGMSGAAVEDKYGNLSGEAYTKLTLIYGRGVTLQNLKEFLDQATLPEPKGETGATVPVFQTNFIGEEINTGQALYQLFYLLDNPEAGTFPDESFTRVLRFTPVRSSVMISSPGTFWNELTHEPQDINSEQYRTVDLHAITAYRGKYSSSTPITGVDTAERLRFIHTGVYGFIINNSLASDNMEVYNTGETARLIYIPNKEHFDNNHYVPGTENTSVPDWFKSDSSSDTGIKNQVERALTTDFDANYFFLPLITVTDTMLIFAGGGVISLEDAIFNGDTVISIPSDGSGTNLESGIIYDAWNHPDRCNSNLFKEAKLVYEKYRRGLHGVYQKTEVENEPELINLETYNPKPVNSLVRTLQMMTGLTWQLSNIVWIDPLLKQGDDDDASSPALKMFSGYDKIFEYEDTFSGKGSILTPETTIVYLLRAYSSSVIPFDVSWGKRLPAGMHHIAFALDRDTPAVTSPDFNWVPMNYKTATVNFQLMQQGSGPTVTDLEFHRQFFDLSGLNLTVSDSFSTLEQLILYYGSYSSLNVAASVTDTVYVIGANILRASLKTAYIRLREVRSITDTTFIPTPAVHSNLTAINTFLYLDGNNTGGMTNAVIDVTFHFMDLRESELREARDLSRICSLIKVVGTVRSSKLRFTILDSGNTSDWIAPDGHTTYSSDVSVGGRSYWQAFDPDILLPRSDNNTTKFPDVFTFIDCGLLLQPGDDVVNSQGRLIDCDVIVDLTDDFIRREPVSLKHVSGGYNFNSLVDSQFFASRMFRKSPYIFYFADRSPVHYLDQTNYSGAEQSENVRLKFVLGPNVDRMAVRYDCGTSDEEESPLVPDPDIESRYYSRVFISGLKNSSVDMPSTYMPAVIKRSFEYKTADTDINKRRYRTYQQESGVGGMSVALFEAVTDSTLTLGLLDTTYPLQDEWEYLTADYSETEGARGNIVYWAEPANGFKFFTYPIISDKFYSAGGGFHINRGNTLNVNEWITRQNISGIYSLYDSTVTIRYFFTTQGMYLNTPDSEFIRNYYGFIPGSGLKGPVRWDMDLADPGAIRIRKPAEGLVDILGTDDPEAYAEYEENSPNLVYLPVTPLFYLAETYSCKVSLELAACHGYEFNLPLGGTVTHPYLRERYAGEVRTDDRRITASPDCVPSFVPDYSISDPSIGLPSYGSPKQRVLRLAVGYTQLLYDSRTGRLNMLFAPSSYNTITAHITRANLVAGVMNRIEGWCYRLMSTRVTDFTPERYHQSGDWDLFDIFDPQAPFTGSVQDIITHFTEYVRNNLARYRNTAVLGPNLVGLSGSSENQIFFGTGKAAAVTRELSFDCCAPGVDRYEPRGVLASLALLHADYPIMGRLDDTTLEWISTPQESTFENVNAVVHASSKEWGSSGFDLVTPGYYGTVTVDSSGPQLTLIENPNAGLGCGYAGPLSEPSALKYYVEQPSSHVTEGTVSSMPIKQLYWNQTETKTFAQRTPMVDALNVADLNVIQIATSDINYVNPIPATLNGERVENIFNNAEFNLWKIPRGSLLHTVAAQGWLIAYTAPAPDLRRERVIGWVDSRLPGLSRGLASGIADGLIDGELTVGEGRFVIPTEWLIDRGFATEWSNLYGAGTFEGVTTPNIPSGATGSNNGPQAYYVEEDGLEELLQELTGSSN